MYKKLEQIETLLKPLSNPKLIAKTINTLPTIYLISDDYSLIILMAPPAATLSTDNLQF